MPDLVPSRTYLIPCGRAAACTQLAPTAQRHSRWSAAAACFATAQQRFRNLVGGLESEILALGRKLQAYEQQLTALGVPLPGPYGAGGAGEHPRLAAVGAGGSLPQGEHACMHSWTGHMFPRACVCATLGASSCWDRQRGMAACALPNEKAEPPMQPPWCSPALPALQPRCGFWRSGSTTAAYI